MPYTRGVYCQPKASAHDTSAVNMKSNHKLRRDDCWYGLNRWNSYSHLRRVIANHKQEVIIYEGKYDHEVWDKDNA